MKLAQKRKKTSTVNGSNKLETINEKVKIIIWMNETLTHIGLNNKKSAEQIIFIFFNN